MGWCFPVSTVCKNYMARTSVFTQTKNMYLSPLNALRSPSPSFMGAKVPAPSRPKCCGCPQVAVLSQNQSHSGVAITCASIPSKLCYSGL